ncbi:MAG: rhodanese-like domain-containing protein [Hansschlegelia sp.]
MTRSLLKAAALALALLPSAALAGGPGSAPEPEGLWTGPLASYTPSTLKGAEVVETAAVADLAEKGAVLLDVGPADRRPDTLPKTAIWLPQHRAIPGSVWMPGAGEGVLRPEQEKALKDRALALAGGDLAKPVVTYCKPDCWGSWNLGKRLVGWGFTNVRWYPAGVNGWQESDRPTVPVRIDAEWRAATAPAAER